MFNEKEILDILDLVGFALAENCYTEQSKNTLTKIKEKYKDNEKIQEAVKDLEKWC